jgi:hypothetical protein
MFTPESALVRLWVRYIKEGKYSIEQVPQLLNLKEVVQEVLAGENN